MLKLMVVLGFILFFITMVSIVFCKISDNEKNKNKIDESVLDELKKQSDLLEKMTDKTAKPPSKKSAQKKV